MKKILVVYFSHSGNTRVIANNIQAKVGGDLFEIKTVEPYPLSYNAVVEQAGKEQKAGARPKLLSAMEQMDGYDTVFIGYPNWWGTMPMGVFTFLEAYDLSNKTLVPFCTHEGSGLGRSINELRKLCPNSTVLEGLAIRGGSVSRAQNDVAAWLQTLSIK